jgi:hypothetical protein
MKMVFFMGLYLTATLLSFGQVEKTTSDQKGTNKKVQHVMVVMNKNGKEIKIDTTFNFQDKKVILMKVDSILKKLEVADCKPGESNVVILRGGKNMHTFSKSGSNLPGEEHFQIYVTCDDTGKVKYEKKVVRIAHGVDLPAFDSDGELIPPPPPVPPFHMKSFKLSGGDPFAMDPDDKDIISYDKKDIGKGLEKITIIRKKQSSKSEEKEVQVKVEVSDEQKK